MQTFSPKTTASNSLHTPQMEAGGHLNPSSSKGLWSDGENKATHKCSRVEGGLPGYSKLQGPVSEPNSASCNGQLNSGSLHKQTTSNAPSGDVCTPVEDHDVVPSLSHNIKTRHIPGCLNVMAKLLSRSTQFSQNGQYICRCSNRSVKSSPHLM